MSLAPCPHCGEPGVIRTALNEFWVACEHCDASGTLKAKKSDAIAAWNRRASPADGVVVPREPTEAMAQAGIVAAMEAATEFMEDDFWKKRHLDAIERAKAGDFGTDEDRAKMMKGVTAFYGAMVAAASPALAATSGGGEVEPFGWRRETITGGGVMYSEDPQDLSDWQSWNLKDRPITLLYATPPSADADKLLIAREALERAQSCLSTRIPGGVLNGDDTMSVIRQALARLSTTEAVG